MSEITTHKAAYPDYSLFRSVCDSGLSRIRPLREAALVKDEWGWNFGSGWPPSYLAYGRMRAMMTLLEATAVKPNSVLEVAAGDAALSACLANTCQRVVANDLLSDQLQQSVANFTNCARIQIVPGNLFELDPDDTGLFDLVVAGEILEHVAHTAAFLGQLKRFVAPGGHILITTPNGAYFRNKLPTHSEIKNFDDLEAQQFKPDADGHLFLITPDELAGLARSVGLGIERMTLWGTPLLTGHVRLSKLASRSACWACYQLERLAQQLPLTIRQKACFNLSAIMRIV